MEINDCHKVRFSKKDAIFKLNVAKREGRMKNGRVYQCENCNYWHLTHEEKKSKIERPVKLKYKNKWQKLLH